MGKDVSLFFMFTVLLEVEPCFKIHYHLIIKCVIQS